MMDRLSRAIIFWARGRQRANRHLVRRDATSAGDFSFRRLEILWPDEWVSDDETKRWNRPPWWRPFNAFVHWWKPRHDGEIMHDHPRWSVTICLRGCLIERTPWDARRLTPGSVVFRSRKAIHSFHIPPEHRGKTWTIFIVGRRNHPQNHYRITPLGTGTATEESDREV